MILDSLERALCQMQGHLFELSAEKGYNSEAFVRAFMTSHTAGDLDKAFHRLQWAGEVYILSCLLEEKAKAGENGKSMDQETLCQIGYFYRYWHFYTGESSREIYRQAPIAILKELYFPYDDIGMERTIDRIKEDYIGKRAKISCRGR